MKSKLATLLMLCCSVAQAGSPYCRTCYPTSYVQPVVSTPYVAPTTQVFAVTNVYPPPLVPPGTTQTVGTGYSVLAIPFLDPNRFLADQNLLNRDALASNAAANNQALVFASHTLELEQPIRARAVAADGAERVLRAAGLDGVYNQTATEPNPPLAAQQTTMLVQRDAAGKIYLTPVSAAQIAQLQAQQNAATPPPMPAEQPPANPPVAAPAPGTFKAVPPLPPPSCAMPGPTVTPPAPAVSTSSSSPYPTFGVFCAKCHGIAVAQPKGGVLLDPSAKDLEVNYYRIRKVVSNGKMPPAGQPQPNNQQRTDILGDVARMIDSTHTK